MILVDTSVWIDHLRSRSNLLATLLHDAAVWTHPFVIGELACGNMGNRTEILMLLDNLPHIKVATDDEVLFYIDQQKLMGRGIGYVDAHLLAACALAGAKRLCTLDKRLATLADNVLAG